MSNAFVSLVCEADPSGTYECLVGATCQREENAFFAEARNVDQ